MKVTILLVLIGLSAIMAHTHKILITSEHIEELRKTSTYEVMDFESHPFKNYSAEDFVNKLGLMRDYTTPQKMIFYGDASALPAAFDGRTQWPTCVHAVRNQASCGSCWAFAASESISDRFCIASQGATNVILSPQDLVSCDTNNFGCQGGYVDKSWDYIRDNGLVSEECLPYTSGSGDSGTCPWDSAADTCVGSGTFRKYHVSAHGQHVSIAAAKEALSTQGPIEAAFQVYSDFMSYKSGVYRRNSNQLLGGHAVKIVGWGQDTDGTEYWIVANSWGTTWGEQGFFRMAFGQCGFEEMLWSGAADFERVTKSDGFFLHHH